MDKRKMKKLLILNLPYFLVGLFATNLGEAWRLAEGADSSAKILSFFHALPIALNNPLPSFHPLDLLIGILCGAGLRLAVYLKGKNAKKYRHNVEYGSARWGTAKDIEPFIAPKFEDNVILTKTERLMMSNRPKNPANARNKNVLIIGGSGSGKTRFWLKPNLLQMHSSYVVTDPKGSIVIECGNALLKHGYTIKIFNTINFQKSIQYHDGCVRCGTARYKRKRRYHIRKYCHRCFGIGNNGRNADGNGFGSFARLVPAILYRAGHDVRFGNHHLCDRLRSND